MRMKDTLPHNYRGNTRPKINYRTARSNVKEAELKKNSPKKNITLYHMKRVTISPPQSKKGIYS